IAAQLQRTKSAVGGLIHRAKLYLRENLERDHPLIQLWLARKELLKEHIRRLEASRKNPAIFLRTQGAETDFLPYMSNEPLADVDEELRERSRKLRRNRSGIYIVRKTLVFPETLTLLALANLRSGIERDLEAGMGVVVQLPGPEGGPPSL